MSKRIDFMHIPLDCLTMQQTIEKIDYAIQQKQHISHVVINAAKVVKMQKDRQLFNSVINCDLINADGQSIVWASRLLRHPLPERVAGIDLMQNLVELAYKQQYRIFFFGAREEVVSQVIAIYSQKYSPDIIAGYRNGYFSKNEESKIAADIAHSGAHILFVAISSPKKENFLYNHREKLKDINFTMGVGGSFDVVAGKIKRAPRWMQKYGLEWFYRLLQEPRRMWKRYLVTNSLFVWYVFKFIIKHN